MPSLKDRFGAFSLGNVQITCPEWGRSVHAYQWLLERKPLFNACIKKKERVQVMSLRYRKKKNNVLWKISGKNVFKNLWSVCLNRHVLSGECHENESTVWVFPPVLKKNIYIYTVDLSLWFNATARSRPLRKLPKSQFKPSEMAKCLPSGIIEFGA